MVAEVFKEWNSCRQIYKKDASDQKIAKHHKALNNLRGKILLKQPEGMYVCDVLGGSVFHRILRVDRKYRGLPNLAQQ